MRRPSAAEHRRRLAPRRAEDDVGEVWARSQGGEVLGEVVGRARVAEREGDEEREAVGRLDARGSFSLHDAAHRVDLHRERRRMDGHQRARGAEVVAGTGVGPSSRRVHRRRVAEHPHGRVARSTAGWPRRGTRAGRRRPGSPRAARRRSATAAGSTTTAPSAPPSARAASSTRRLQHAPPSARAGPHGARRSGRHRPERRERTGVAEQASERQAGSERIAP